MLEVNLTITLILRKKELFLEGTQTVREALDKLGLSPETHLAIRNGELLTDREHLKDGDVVKLVPVISGGNQ
jgi:sulfur carrier protein ThiS